MRRTIAILCASVLCASCVLDAGSAAGTRPDPPQVGVAPEEPRLASDPMLVRVDTDRKVTALPGESTAVFIEYGTGGRWHVWWTCDARNAKRAAVSGCFFHVAISSESELSDALYDHDANHGARGISSPNPRRIEAQTLTNDDLGGVTFTSNPGATIQITVQIDDQYVAPFFFIQNGKVNGGFEGTLTDPLFVAP